MKIPYPIEHIDCPKCTRHIGAASIYQISVEHKMTDTKCGHCGGEGVIRKDGLPVLRTVLTDERIVRYKP